MSDQKDPVQIIRETMHAARLCIVGGPARTGDGYVAVVMRGEHTSVPTGPYEHKIEGHGETLADAINECEEKAMEHLGQKLSEPTEAEVLAAKVAELEGKIKAMQTASAPAPAPSRPAPAPKS